ncbi:MAG: hypothetical protein KAU48_07785, partial [Candidatus Thorarchaeota archaeon]|nr:hypothetical protein [Candidatus Thorarchaeota archaeon]
IIKEFEIPISSECENVLTVRWLTPPIDVVTGYFVEAMISQEDRYLPTRAIDVTRKQFTVY